MDLSATIRGYWTRFAATGDPNGGGARTWPGTTRSQTGIWSWATPSAPATGLYKDACDLADRVSGLE